MKEGERVFMERLYALRGATQLDIDTPQEMQDKVLALMKALFEKNSIVSEKVVSIQFSVTHDLQSMNPATAFRKTTGEGSIPLFCSQEPVVVDMPERTVRVMIQLYRDENLGALQPVYHGETKILRPDITS